MPKLKIDNPLFRFMGKLGDLILLNLVWTICCVPLITIGAANTALFYVARKMAAGEEYRIFREFFKSFRQNWKQATLAWLILVPLGILALADLVIGFSTPGVSGNIFRGIGVVLCILWLMAEGYVFILLARYEYRLPQLFSNVVYFGVTNFTATISMVALTLWLPLLIWRSPDIGLYALPIWLLLGGALSALIVSSLLLPAFRRLESTSKEDET